MSEYSVYDEDIDVYPSELSPESEYLVEVTRLYDKRTRQAGMGFFLEFAVVETSNAADPIGAKRVFKLFDTLGEKNPDGKAPKQRNIRGILAAVLNKDPEDPEYKGKWGQAVEYSNKTNCFGRDVKKKDGSLVRGGRGVFLRVKTGPRVKNKNRGERIDHTFSNAEGEAK